MAKAHAQSPFNTLNYLSSGYSAPKPAPYKPPPNVQIPATAAAPAPAAAPTPRPPPKGTVTNETATISEGLSGYAEVLKKRRLAKGQTLFAGEGGYRPVMRLGDAKGMGTATLG